MNNIAKRCHEALCKKLLEIRNVKTGAANIDLSSADDNEPDCLSRLRSLISQFKQRFSF